MNAEIKQKLIEYFDVYPSELNNILSRLQVSSEDKAESICVLVGLYYILPRPAVSGLVYFKTAIARAVEEIESTLNRYKRWKTTSVQLINNNYLTMSGSETIWSISENKALDAGHKTEDLMCPLTSLAISLPVLYLKIVPFVLNQQRLMRDFSEGKINVSTSHRHTH